MKSLRTRAVTVATGLMIMGGPVPAFASGNPIDPPAVADGAAVEPGTVTGKPASGDGAISGVEDDTALEEDLPIPGESDGPDLGDARTPRSKICPPPATRST
ncbi:hypothetical protein GCM10010449_81880 [Streptomyces rectiviolaceus]|uniref:Secreted protein n=1 Tax=Streptomyces rectiviolaceus TaxID=332591 RepID=A0ABP6NKC3_9ACTN